MPVTSIVPAPSATWPYRVQYPGPFNNRRSRETFRAWADENRLSQSPSGSSGVNVNGPNGITAIGQAESGATGSDIFDLLDGVTCSNTVTAPRGVGWTFPWWTPVFDGTLLPNGYRIPEGGVVGVLDVSLRTGWAAGGPADMVGAWIGGGLDASSGALYRQQTPGGASPGLNTGGAGFLLRVDGTGYDYVAWGVGGVVTERIAVPLVPTVWHVFRFVLVSAQPGGFARLELSVDGAPFRIRNYGTAALPVPYARTPGVNGRPAVPALAITGNAVTPPSGVAYAFQGKWGRFLPDGREVQPE